jgi:hypothetical protein
LAEESSPANTKTARASSGKPWFSLDLKCFDSLTPVRIVQGRGKRSFFGSGSGAAIAWSSEEMNLTTVCRRFGDVANLKEVFADDSLRGEFIILEADANTFLQAGGEGDGPYTLEYKERGK